MTKQLDYFEYIYNHHAFYGNKSNDLNHKLKYSNYDGELIYSHITGANDQNNTYCFQTYHSKLQV